MQSHLETLFTLELPYREQLTLQRRVFEGGDRPRVAVVSGIHGDELEGLYVSHRLAQWLEELEQEDPGALLGRVELYPAMNPLGLDTLERFVPTHDWAEVLNPGAGWRGFDATHNLLADATYIRVAVGRDHHDAAPQRGSFKGDQEGEAPEVVLRVSRQQ